MVGVLPTVNEDVFAKCQVNTPANIACRMLDMAGYKDDLMGARVLESSFGDGSLLDCIVRRYIEGAMRSGHSPDEIRIGLASDVVGYEIDETLVSHVRLRLSATAARYGIHDVSWNLIAGDSLCIGAQEKYRYIIGNPPYLESKAMRAEVRDYLRETFESCRWGKFDYCYAFLEKGLSLLEYDGIMVQLVPSSILSNLSARSLRNLLLEGVTHIATFPTGNVFDHALVSPCIIRYQRDAGNGCVTVANWEGEERDYPMAKRDEDWTSAYNRINPKGKRFGDAFTASMPVATLCNDAFLLREDEEVERTVMRQAACPRQLRAGTKMSIIFPYLEEEDGTFRRIDNGEFENSFPRAASHLSRFRTRLERRKSDQRARWFEYGRSQGITLVKGDTKLMLSTVISKEVRVYEIPPGVVPYGGIVVSPKEGTSICHAKAVLESEEFLAYAYAVGTRVSGSSVRITSRHINNYRYTIDEDAGHEEADI